MSCIVCFDNILKSQSIECSDPFCTVRLCKECLEMSLNIAYKDGVIPNCPHCKIEYTLSNIKNHISENTILEKYYKVCFLQIDRDKGDIAKKELTEDKILQRIREERNLFIQREFPVAISHVANIALKSKMNRLEKKTRDKLEKDMEKAFKRCFNLNCFGQLNKDYKCNYCDTQFCEMCEEEKEPKHKCKQENIDTITFLNSIVKCPKCKIPIERSEGCNSMTCAHCHTNFDYTNGQEGGHGSVNHTVELREHYTLLNEYQNIINDDEIEELISEFDSLKKVDKIDVNEFKRILKNHYLYNSNQILTGKKLAEKLNLVLKKRYYNKLYIHSTKTIKRMILNEQLTVPKLQKVITRLEQYWENKSENGDDDGEENGDDDGEKVANGKEEEEDQSVFKHA